MFSISTVFILFVDIFIQFVADYHARICSKKPVVDFFGWVLNTSKVNALQLFCNVHSKKIGLLEFARNIVINVPLFMGNKTLQEH